MDLYLVKTPRQWLLSHVLIEQRKQMAIMVISEGFSGAAKLEEVNKSFQSDYLKATFLIPGKSTFAQKPNQIKIRKRGFWRLAKKDLESISNQFSISSVFSANPSSVQLQFLHFLNPSAVFHVIDDGLETYREKPQKKYSKASLIVKSIKYGFPFKAPDSGLIFEYFKNGWFLEPTRVDIRFNQLEKHQIDRDLFRGSSLTILKNRVFQIFGFEFDASLNKKVIIVLSRTAYLEEVCQEYSLNMGLDRIRRYLYCSEFGDSKVFVKYHPREKCRDVYGFEASLKDVLLIPQTIPFELLYDSINDQDLVIGEVSTALFDIALNKPNTKIVSIMCSSSNKDVKLSLIEAGVEIFEDVDE